MSRWTFASWMLLAGALLLGSTIALRACPFCAAPLNTLSEDIDGVDVAVIAKLAKPAEVPAGIGGIGMQKAAFEIVDIIKGQEILGQNRAIEALYFGDKPVGSKFLITGLNPAPIAWATPTALSDDAVSYITQLMKLPESGTKRLAFVQDYFENKDPLLANDSYDEFAKVPYAEILELKDQLHHDKLLGWVKDNNTSTSHRRLYLTLLGVCGTEKDLPMLEKLIRDEDRQVRLTLDALVACYLTLRGADGMPLVEDLFLKNQDADYVDTYAAIMALRFHGQETKAVPRERLVQGLRYMLERPRLADLVIPDLARWQDWSVMDKMVQLFKDADEDTIWIRVQVASYLRACPLPEAKTHLEELAKIDPKRVEQASQFFFPPGTATKPPPGSQRPKTDAAAPAGTAPAIAPAADAKPSLPPLPSDSSATERRSVKLLSTSVATDSSTTKITTASAVVPVSANMSNEPLASASVSEPAEPQTFPELAEAKQTAAATPLPILDAPQPTSGIHTGMILLWSTLAGGGLLMLMLTILRGSNHDSGRV